MATVLPVRLILAVSSVLLVLTSCTADGSEGDHMSARDAEASYVASLEEAVPLAARTVEATKVEVVGRWQSCMGGFQYQGTGAVHVDGPGDEAQVERVRSALTDAGWDDVTQVEGHVSVEKGDLALDLTRPGGAFPGLWTLAFHSDCRVLHGEDKDYAEQGQVNHFTGLRP
ncbi:MAG: hypothetical protein JWO76_2889 [Nocardioides sp.]|nr:hypothetical protein [Nocardioides sp.]